MTTTLGFITQHELDPIVGYRRRRERLEGKALPKGARIKTFSQEPIVFPEFAVMGLVLDASVAGAPLKSAAERVYGARSFGGIREVIKRVARGNTAWTLTDIAVALLDRAQDDFLEWRDVVAGVEADLAAQDLRMKADIGRIVKVGDREYLLRLFDTDEVIKCAVGAARSQLPLGMWVARGLVEYGAHRGEVLMPTVEPDVLAAVRERETTGDEAEQELTEMFSKVDFKPIAIPRVYDTVAKTEDANAGDLVRAPGRIRVSANRSLYARANTMARSQQTARPAR